MEAGEIRWDVDYESFVCSCAGRKRMERGGVEADEISTRECSDIYLLS